MTNDKRGIRFKDHSSALDRRPKRARVPAMIRLFLVALCLSVIGCSYLRPDVSPEDREFFYGGWIHPHRDSEAPSGPPPSGGNFKSDPLID